MTDHISTALLRDWAYLAVIAGQLVVLALAVPAAYRRGVRDRDRIAQGVLAELEQRVADAAPTRQSPPRRRSRPNDLTEILPRPFADPWRPDFDKTALIPRYNPERPQ